MPNNGQNEQCFSKGRRSNFVKESHRDRLPCIERKNAHSVPSIAPVDWEEAPNQRLACGLLYLRERKRCVELDVQTPKERDVMSLETRQSREGVPCGNADVHGEKASRHRVGLRFPSLCKLRQCVASPRKCT